MKLFEQIAETVAFLQTKTNFSPEIGIILGTGLSNLANDIEVVAKISYKDIPNFPVSTVASHKGELVFGYLSGILCASDYTCPNRDISSNGYIYTYSTNTNFHCGFYAYNRDANAATARANACCFHTRAGSVEDCYPFLFWRSLSCT